MDESFVVGGPVGDSELLLCHGMVCVVGRIRDLILQLSKSSIYSTKPLETGRRIKNLSLINGDNERTIVDHAPFVGSIVPAVMRFFQANIEEGSRSLLSA